MLYYVSVFEEQSEEILPT